VFAPILGLGLGLGLDEMSGSGGGELETKEMALLGEDSGPGTGGGDRVGGDNSLKEVTAVVVVL